jgi:predicted DsbA family dithiol-disulfide isomerase
VINDRYALVGAQPYEVFKNALEQIMNQKDWRMNWPHKSRHEKKRPPVRK